MLPAFPPMLGPLRRELPDETSFRVENRAGTNRLFHGDIHNVYQQAKKPCKSGIYMVFLYVVANP